MESGPRSFGKSLYFGHIPEALVVPYPTLRKELMQKYPKHAWPEDPRTSPAKRYARERR